MLRDLLDRAANPSTVDPTSRGAPGATVGSLPIGELHSSINLDSPGGGGGGWGW